MSDTREVHAYAYVNRPYGLVVDLLRIDAVGVFQRATASATARAKALVSTMRATLGPLEVGADVVVRVRGIDQTTGPLGPTTRLRLEWHASSHAEVFPTMEATLSVYALGGTETQLDFDGSYRPPFGILGVAVDAVVGHRIAEASVRRFVDDVAERVRVDVPTEGELSEDSP
jgi:hypothetical protein